MKTAFAIIVFVYLLLGLSTCPSHGWSLGGERITVAQGLANEYPEEAENILRFSVERGGEVEGYFDDVNAVRDEPLETRARVLIYRYSFWLGGLELWDESHVLLLSSHYNVGTGTTAYKLVALGSDITLTNTGWGPDGLVFDGTAFGTGDRVTRGGATFSVLADYTVTGNFGSRQTIVSQWIATGNQRSWFLEYNVSGLAGNGIFISSDGDDFGLYITAPNFPDGIYGATLDGITKTEYRDGVSANLEFSDQGSSVENDAIFDSSAPLYVGAFNEGSISLFAGTIRTTFVSTLTLS